MRKTTFFSKSSSIGLFFSLVLFCSLCFSLLIPSVSNAVSPEFTPYYSNTYNEIRSHIESNANRYYIIAFASGKLEYFSADCDGYSLDAGTTALRITCDGDFGFYFKNSAGYANEQVLNNTAIVRNSFANSSSSLSSIYVIESNSSYFYTMPTTSETCPTCPTCETCATVESTIADKISRSVLILAGVILTLAFFKVILNMFMGVRR